jgi:hypothetical protein
MNLIHDNGTPWSGDWHVARPLHVVCYEAKLLESFRKVIDNYLMHKFCLHCGYPYGKLFGLLFPSYFEVSVRAGQEWQLMREDDVLLFTPHLEVIW